MLRERLAQTMEEILTEGDVREHQARFDWDFQIGVNPQGEQVGLFSFVRGNITNLGNPKSLITCTVAVPNPFALDRADLTNVLEHAMGALDEEQSKLLSQAQDEAQAMTEHLSA